jgi:hypothetical protein
MVKNSGGNPPYKYCLNNGAYQSSNKFELPKAGLYEFKIKDAQNFVRYFKKLIQ